MCDNMAVECCTKQLLSPGRCRCLPYIFIVHHALRTLRTFFLISPCLPLNVACIFSVATWLCVYRVPVFFLVHVLKACQMTKSQASNKLHSVAYVQVRMPNTVHIYFIQRQHTTPLPPLPPRTTTTLATQRIRRGKSFQLDSNGIFAVDCCNLFSLVCYASAALTFCSIC